MDGIDILFYNGVKLQINKWLKNQENRKFLNKEYKVDVNNALFVSNGHLLNLSNAKSRQFYNVIIDNKSEKPHSLCYWYSSGFNDEERIISSFMAHRIVTKDTRLLALQFKICHNIIATNKRKNDWKIVESEKCDFCTQTDTLVHHLWDCSFTKEILTNCCNQLALNSLDFKKWDFIFGKNELAHDNICLIIKASIYDMRISRNKFSAKCFLRDVAIRRFADRITLNAQKFQEIWSFSDALQLDKYL